MKRQLASVALLIALSNHARAADVSIIDSVQSTLQLKLDIKIQQEEVIARRGVAQSAKGQFDTSLLLSLGHRGETIPLTASMQLALPAPGWTSVDRQTTSYRIGAAQQLRFGTTFLPTIELSRVGETGVSPAYGRARVSFAVVQPLVRGRGASAVAAQERSARLAEEAARQDLRYTIAVRVAATGQAYWAWRATRDTLDIFRENEKRAEVLLKEEQALVTGGEHPKADSKQFEANLADAEAFRLDAQRADIEARQNLGVQMGLPWESMSGLTAPTSELPTVAERDVPAGERLNRLVAESLPRRPDLLAANIRVQAAETLAVAARRNLEPQLDLALDIGWSGLTESDGGTAFVAPIGERISGVNAGANLSFSYPMQNNAARGALSSRRAEVQKARLAAQELARTIGAAIVVAAEALRAAVRAQASADRAAALYAEAVANERKKLRAGLSTSLDVILTQARLTNAELAAVRARSRVADALTRLRFETGTLVETTDQGGTVALEALTTPPP
jgi:outer membrane protein TolC